MQVLHQAAVPRHQRASKLHPSQPLLLLNSPPHQVHLHQHLLQGPLGTAAKAEMPKQVLWQVLLVLTLLAGVSRLAAVSPNQISLASDLLALRVLQPGHLTMPQEAVVCSITEMTTPARRPCMCGTFHRYEASNIYCLLVPHTYGVCCPSYSHFHLGTI